MQLVFTDSVWQILYDFLSHIIKIRMPKNRKWPIHMKIPLKSYSELNWPQRLCRCFFFQWNKWYILIVWSNEALNRRSWCRRTMKCFSWQLVRKFLILSAAMMVLINLLCMWKVSDQIEKEKEKKLEAKLTIKLEKVNHSSFIKPWHSKVTTESGQQSTSRGQLSTDRRKQEDKSPVSNTCVSYFI